MDEIKISKADLNMKSDFRKVIILNYRMNKELYANTDFWDKNYPSTLSSKREIRNLDRKSLVLLAQDENELKGLLIMSPGKTEYSYTIKGLYVIPSLRKSGLGKELLEVAVKWAMKRSVRYILIDISSSNDSAKSLFRKNGFKEISNVMMRRI